MSTRKKASVEIVTPEALQKLVNDRFGAGTMKMASDPEFRITRLPSGVLAVDAAIGGGFPRGRYIEPYGDFGTGKTCLGLHLIAETQRNGGNCAYIDGERTYDSVWARHIGVKNKKLALFPQKKTGNEVVDFMELLLRSGAYDVIVLDSIASLLPKAERDASMEDGSMGTEQAKMMSKALRKLTPANTGRTVVFCINQTREAVGTMFGNRMITSGGKAMGFYAGLRLEFTRIETIKGAGKSIDLKTGNESDKDLPVAHRVQIRISKNKTGGGKPEDRTTLVYDYGLGNFDPIEDLLFIGRRTGVIRKTGDNWVYGATKINGRKKFKKYVSNNEMVQKSILDKINKELKNV